MADKWVEALQKVAPLTAPQSRPGDSLVNVLLDKMYGFDDDIMVAEKVLSVYDDPADATGLDPAGDLVKAQRDATMLAKTDPIVAWRNGFLERSAVLLEKRAPGAPMSLFFQLSKIDEDKRMVFGCAAAEEPDRQNEILDYVQSKPFFQKWSESVRKDSQGKSAGNVREMHTLSAVGTLDQIQFDDAAKKIEVAAKIVDNDAWAKCKAGVYCGFSIGGKYAKTWQDGGLTRYVADPSEVSLVDRPAIPSATFEMVKTDGSKEVCKFKHYGGEPMTPEEYMAHLHRRHSNHFTDTAKSHKEAASHHEGLAAHFKKSDDGEAEKHHTALAEGHHDRAERDSVLAAWHHNSMEHCEKVTAARKAATDAMAKVADGLAPSVLESAVRETFLKMFGDVVMPSRISAVAPNRLVPRAGEKPIPAAPNVDPQFAKLISVENEQE